MLNYDNSCPSNRIVITNKDKNLYPSAVFVKVLDNEEDVTKMQKAKKLSEKLGVPCIEIDKALCRERLGLNPLTEKEEKDKRVL